MAEDSYKNIRGSAFSVEWQMINLNFGYFGGVTSCSMIIQNQLSLIPATSDYC